MSSATDTTAAGATGTTTGVDLLVRAGAVAEPGPDVAAVDAALTPPPSTSPRWYRRGGDLA